MVGFKCVGNHPWNTPANWFENLASPRTCINWLFMISSFLMEFLCVCFHASSMMNWGPKIQRRKPEETQKQEKRKKKLKKKKRLSRISPCRFIEMITNRAFERIFLAWFWVSGVWRTDWRDARRTFRWRRPRGGWLCGCRWFEWNGKLVCGGEQRQW